MRKRVENFKFTIVSILVLALFGGLAYWAFSSIESGSTHVRSEKQKELEKRIEELSDENYQLRRQLDLVNEEKENERLAEIEAKEKEIEKVEQQIPVKTTEPTKPTTNTPTTTKTYKYQTLIDELQKLSDKEVYLKLKSQGTAVGTVQKFLNIYNNTNNKIDNDYGATTVTLVKNFQKAQGIKVDGETGPGTYKKMIAWLKTK